MEDGNPDSGGTSSSNEPGEMDLSNVILSVSADINLANKFKEDECSRLMKGRKWNDDVKKPMRKASKRIIADIGDKILKKAGK